MFIVLLGFGVLVKFMVNWCFDWLLPIHLATRIHIVQMHLSTSFPLTLLAYITTQVQSS